MAEFNFNFEAKAHKILDIFLQKIIFGYLLN